MAKAKCNKMNARIKKMWTDALRSGHYRQGKTYLNHRGRFCCLGVLTDLYIQQDPSHRKWRDYGTGDGTMSFQGDAQLIPQDVVEWAGLMGNSPIVKVGESPKRKSLTELNDKGTSFETIADFIEKSL